MKTLLLFESPPLPTKTPKIKNTAKKNNTPANNDMMGKIEKIEEKLENYESSNKDMEAIESPPLPTKAPKIKNLSEKNTPSNNVMMEKIEKIEEKLENYKSSNKDMKAALASNMEAIDGFNTKLDKISELLGVLTENGGKMNEAYPVRLSELFLTNIFENAIRNGTMYGFLRRPQKLIDLQF